MKLPKISVFFDWSDFGVGVFWDKERRVLYLFFVPTVGIAIVL